MLPSGVAISGRAILWRIVDGIHDLGKQTSQTVTSLCELCRRDKIPRPRRADGGADINGQCCEMRQPTYAWAVSEVTRSVSETARAAGS
jgi:hypothetical protein